MIEIASLRLISLTTLIYGEKADLSIKIIYELENDHAFSE
jgi:hypothetical protein